MTSTLLTFFAITCFATLTLARPGIWYTSTGSSAVVGGDTLTCDTFYLSAYGPLRLVCGGCICPGLDDGWNLVVQKNHPVHVNFDHVLSTVTVDGISYPIPNTVERYGCESNAVKAFSYGCGGTPELVYLRSTMPLYVCQESFQKSCVGQEISFLTKKAVLKNYVEAK